MSRFVPICVWSLCTQGQKTPPEETEHLRYVGRGNRQPRCRRGLHSTQGGDPCVYTRNNGGHVGSQGGHQGPNGALPQFFYSDALFADASLVPGTLLGHLIPGWTGGGRPGAPPEAAKWVTVPLVPFLSPLCPRVVMVRWVGDDDASRSPRRGPSDIPGPEPL